MPRDGSGVYDVPPGTEGTPNTTILSAAYNAFLADLTADLNAARPITAGGTGGTSVITGWDGLAAAGTDVASSGTINLTTATGPLIDLTGTTAVSTVTLAEGAVRLVRATGAFRLTAGASLVVNGSTSASYTTTAGDLLLFRGYGSSVVRVWTINTPQYNLAPYPSGHLYGLTLSAGTDATNDINVAVGTARDDADSANMDLLTALGKQYDSAWAVGGTTGTPLGGNFAASATDGTKYIWLIKRPDTGVVDAGFSTSSTDPSGDANYPAAYTIRRLIGSFIRTSGVNGKPTLVDPPFSVTSGTYTPTLTNTTNIGASTAYLAQYIQIGKTVWVSGKCDIDPTSSGSTMNMGISLPIPSAFTTDRQLGGSASSAGLNPEGSYLIQSDATNDRALLSGNATTTINHAVSFIFMYQVL